MTASTCFTPHDAAAPSQRLIERSAELPTWSAVCTCSEPRKLVEAFVAHHLDLGAERVFLFFDDPHDIVAHSLSRHANVSVQLCNADYWAEWNGGRPDDHRRRQTLNAQYAARKLCTSDWLAHIDADEFLFPRGQYSIPQILSGVPQHFDVAQVSPAERMLVQQYVDGDMRFDGVFKLRPGKGVELGVYLYGPALGAAFPDGFQGHDIGKSFFRCSNKKAKITIHHVKRHGIALPAWRIDDGCLVLLHFFPQSYEDWKWKYERRVLNPNQLSSLRARGRSRFPLYLEVLATGGEAGLRRLFEDLCVVDRAKAEDIVEKGLAFFADLGVDQRKKVFMNSTPGKAFSNKKITSRLHEHSNKKFFQIGMRRAGAREICKMFLLRGYSYVHGDRGNLAKDLMKSKRAGGRPFLEYGEVNLFAEVNHVSNRICLEGFREVDYIAEFYPDSVYIVNKRPVAEWLESCERFCDGAYIDRYRKSLSLRSWAEVREYWRDSWESHIRNLRVLASNGLRVVEWNINTDKPSLVFEKIHRILA